MPKRRFFSLPSGHARAKHFEIEFTDHSSRLLELHETLIQLAKSRRLRWSDCRANSARWRRFGLRRGRTLFVALAAPDDRVRVRIDRVRGKVAFASIEEIIKPSTVRIEPPCPYFGACGGCDFQQLTYQAQLDIKVEIIRDCLRRIAQIENLPEIGIRPAPRQWQYRARANWQFDARTSRLGYFEAGSHRVCDVEVCAVLEPRLQRVLSDIRNEIRRGSASSGMSDR